MLLGYLLSAFTDTVPAVKLSDVLIGKLRQHKQPFICGKPSPLIVVGKSAFLTVHAECQVCIVLVLVCAIKGVECGDRFIIMVVANGDLLRQGAVLALIKLSAA